MFCQTGDEDVPAHGLQRGHAGGHEGPAGVYGHIVQSGLPKDLVELVYLHVSQINGCAYCIDMHSRDLVKQGISFNKVVMVPAWREGGALFSETERAALAWAETVTRVSETNVPDAEYEAAAKVFGEKQLADLTIAIGLMNAYNRLAVSPARMTGRMIAAMASASRGSAALMRIPRD
jgi:AhpD family alkylhydroperoxidase